MPIFYFLNPKDSHILDLLMQSLWNATQYNPLGQYYFSCVPYLLGEGQAMQYSFYPKTEVPKDIPGLPWTAPPNYLRDNMVKTLAEKDVEFDMMGAGPDRPAPDADRERRRALARKAVAARPGRPDSHPEAEVRFAGAVRLRQGSVDQPLALPARASPARQPEPRPPADVQRTLEVPAADERDAPYRADRRRSVRLERVPIT